MTPITTTVLDDTLLHAGGGTWATPADFQVCQVLCDNIQPFIKKQW